MQVSISPNALDWMRKKGIKAITIKDVVARGSCCAGAVKEVVVEKGEPWESGRRYAIYKVDDIDVYVAGNIPPKAESITVVLKNFIFNYLDVIGYEPKAL
jgi:hypothetical protein